jgi:Tol biopolymer transport system component
MSKVDDQLTSRFRGAERPVDGEALFGGLERRRSHRERLRKVQAGLLAFAVLAGTAGGFVALREVFGENGGDVGEPPMLPSNGEIVFSREGDDGRFHLYAAQPDGSGERQITKDATNDTDPAVSPGGETIAFVDASDEASHVIALVPIEGGAAIRLTDDRLRADEPAWSPDGTQVAYVVGGIDSQLINLIQRNGLDPRGVLDFAGQISDLAWSPDGSRILFAARNIEAAPGRPNSWDLGSISLDGRSEFDPFVETERDEEAPAWSPDGARIAFIRPGDEGDQVWTVDPDGGSETLIATAVDASLEPDLAWAPDGTALLVSDGDWTYRVDPTPSGDPRDNFVQLVKGSMPSWQPLPAGSTHDVTPDPEPTASASPEPEGRDVGLGFPLCHVEELSGIDWYGDGTLGAAWTGARTTDDGRCPPALDGEYVVAADLDGDGSAEPGGMGFLEFCLLCRPFAATDMSGDGVLELVVLEEASSTPSYSLYEVSVPRSERSPGIYSLFVAPPGYPAGGFPGGEPIRFSAGGDEGYSAAIDCEGYPETPILVVAWSDYQVDVDDTEDVYVTRLRLGEDGVFHVVASEHLTQDVGDPLPIDPAGKACGVDFNPLA